MGNTHFKEQYWSDRYQNDMTQWDIGYASTPITAYADQLDDKDLRILIPGSGNAYEAEYFVKNGFKNVYILDIAEQPLKAFAKRNPDFPQDQIIHNDFFKLEGKFDLIIEQTFFCAIDPSKRSKYVTKIDDLLSNHGKLIGVLFDDPLYEDHPPFGGNKKMYKSIFSQDLSIEIMETCINSIPPRKNRELFIKIVKK